MKNIRTHPIIFVTGASGVGKTSLVERLSKKPGSREWTHLHFDSIGVPSVADMEKYYGSGSNWQRSMTFEWVRRMLEEYPDEGLIVFEGQTDLQFIVDAFARHSFTHYRIVQMDCRTDVMAERLINLRKQPELVTPDMKNWLAYLRNQAREMGAPSIDTSDMTTKEVDAAFEAIVTEVLGEANPD